MSQKCSQNFPNIFQKKSKNFQKCSKNVPKHSQNSPKTSQKLPKIFKKIQKFPFLFLINLFPKNVKKTIKNQLKNTSGRSSSEVCLNPLHPVSPLFSRTSSFVFLVFPYAFLLKRLKKASPLHFLLIFLF